DADEHPLAAEAVAGLGDRLRAPQRHGAEDHPVDAVGEEPLHRLEAPDAAARLYGHVHRPGDALDDLAVFRHALKGAVKVDDVNALGARRFEILRDRNRVERVHRLTVLRSLHESDAATAFEIDGGDHDHSFVTSPKFLRIASPTALL